MILSIRHKGWRLFYETGSTRGIDPQHAKRLARMLAFLDNASAPDDVNIPGWRLHPLQGKWSGHWSLTISGNWRLVFRFSGNDVERVDYVDYH